MRAFVPCVACDRHVRANEVTCPFCGQPRGDAEPRALAPLPADRSGLPRAAVAGNNPYCHHRALEMKRAGVRERVVRVAEAPGAPFDRASFELVVETVPSALG